MSFSRFCIVTALLATGCEPAELTAPGMEFEAPEGSEGGGTLDSDGDGLTDDEEAELGTDPDSSDTDFDGWDDYEEIERNTDPTNGGDTPYTGGWPIGDCRNDIQADSTLQQGGVAPDFALTDMHGDTVRLHDFCQMAVLFVTGAEWCGPCQSYRANMASYMDQYFSRGLMVIDLLGETSAQQPPNEADLERWADNHDYAVLADPNWEVTRTGYARAYPGISLLGPGAVVVSLDGGDPGGLIEANLPAGFTLPDYVERDMEAAANR